MFSSRQNSLNAADKNVNTRWQNIRLYNEGEKTNGQDEMQSEFAMSKGMLMMQKMGYTTGKGLGKHEQGIKEAVQETVHLGKRGLGSTIVGLEASNEEWDFSKEIVNVEEKVKWLINHNRNDLSLKKMRKWMVEDKPKTTMKNETNFCNTKILRAVFKAKEVFDELDQAELNLARARANPFESIRSVFFMNRAALKMANIDAAADFMFSDIDKNNYHKDHKGPYYFADVCAGPGGFTEYILWRKKWRFKGFGLTLKHENDFKVYNSTCASDATFQTFYGSRGDGDVFYPENIIDFKKKVLHETDQQGVHFMMADGGFCVDGQEEFQETLSSQLYACQCLIALEIIREHGHFVTKLFDVFTPFSVGLLYLMYRCFEKVAILKPNSSRPANSERYFICYGLKDQHRIEGIKKYLWQVVRRFYELKISGDRQPENDLDIVVLVPLDILKENKLFYDYIVESNNTVAEQQIVSLEKLAAFCRNPQLIEPRQDELRSQCLEYWKIPDDPRILKVSNDVSLYNILYDYYLEQPIQMRIENLHLTIKDLKDWYYCPMFTSKNLNHNFYAAIGSSHVCRYQSNKWVRVKNINLANGTFLFGEFVKENATIKTNNSDKLEAEVQKYSLYVIDALRLGNMKLMDQSYAERLKLIDVYCQAINKKCQENFINIRPKPIKPLSSFNKEMLNDFNNISVTSLLFLKADSGMLDKSFKIYLNFIDENESGLAKLTSYMKGLEDF